MIYCRNWEKKVSEYTNIVVSTMYMSTLISDDACNIAGDDQLKILFVACDCLLQLCPYMFWRVATNLY